MVRIALVLTIASALIGAASAAPAGLRHIDAFAVRTVEVTGTRYLAPAEAVAASGITAESNIFDDPQQWLDALLRHPLVLHAAIESALPGTLRLRIEETRPVALARTPELRPIDEHGRVLPVDPAAEGMDLPVLLLDTRVSADARAADPQTRAAVAFLGTVHRLEPDLLGWISEVGLHGAAVRIVLRGVADADVLMPAQPGAERLRELYVTLAELATPRYAANPDVRDRTGEVDSELSQVRRIDGRFHDQFVVALHGRKN